MKSLFPRWQPRRSCSLGVADQVGFSLVELLVVIAIILSLAALIGPAANLLVKGSGVTQAGQVVLDQFSLARQTAIAKNRPVEVRLYQFADPEAAGEGSGNASDGKFRAVQAFEVVVEWNSSGVATTNFVPVSSVKRLPVSMIMDSGSTLSTLIGRASSSAAPRTTSGGVLNQRIPRVGLNYNAVSFRYRSDGSTDLPKNGTKWFVTVHDTVFGDRLGEAPKNFSTVMIDPYNGSTKTFRP